MPQQRLRTLNPRLLLLPFAAFLAVLPLLMHGCSCGHDFGFHLQNWLEAAQQFRSGTLHPQWIFSAAWNAGEPRFVFYPPISWTLGGLLTLIAPFSSTPILYTWVALTAAAISLYCLAREFVSPNAALLAATIYIVNPYMLFTAFERTAYAELLAAAWLPLLLLAALRPRLSIPRIAIPIALLWLTNAPAAVMGCYAFAILIGLRLCIALRNARRKTPASTEPTNEIDIDRRSPQRNLLTAVCGAVLGLTLPASYLVPAAYERRFVQIKMAVIPNLRFQDNFLFGHDGDTAHDTVLHTASLIALTLIVLTAAALVTLHLASKNTAAATEGQPPDRRSANTRGLLLPALITLAALITLLLTPLSTLLWNRIPELSFLQFPWRLLAVLSVVLALSLALLLQRARLTNPITAVLVALIAITLSQSVSPFFRQGCELNDRPAQRAELLATHHGVDPTDEYTPLTADNDSLHTDNPAFWLADSPTAYAPNTTPLDPNSVLSPPITQTVSAQPSMHFVITPTHPQYLILNLRDYPNWQVIYASTSSMKIERPQRIPRDDGLIAIPVLSGPDSIEISWHRSIDAAIGELLSLCALGALIALLLPPRSRKLERANELPPK